MTASLTTPLYWMYELAQASLNPARAMADATRLFYQNQPNPLSHTAFGKQMAAAAELFERTTRRYGKPEWPYHGNHRWRHARAGSPPRVWERPFCKLLHFERACARPPRDPASARADRRADVGPLCHAAASGTVRSVPPEHEVYITDWADARMVPLTDGPVRS